jgi:hypothetical protein
MRFFSLSLLAICLFGSVAAATCSPIPGAEQLWSRPKLRWLIVGELHGSNETPAAFLDLVCDALEHGKRVTVALERSSSEQELLNHILTDSDSAHAVKELLRQRDWREVPDGRSSEAMLHMILALRDLHRSHPQLSIFAFDTSPSSPKGGRDKAMGKALLSLRQNRPQDFILVLTGSAHASEQPLMELGYNPAAAYLPADERVSLDVMSNGGEYWVQTYEDKKLACGPLNLGSPSKNRTRGIVLDPKLAADVGTFDGILSLGIPATASAPAAGELTPLPDCRKQFMSDHQPTKHDQSQAK